MGKASKARKARATAPYPSPSNFPLTAPPSDDASSDSSFTTSPIDPVDLEITIETLQLLLKHPEVLKASAHKSTRSLIHKLHGALGGTFSNSPTVPQDADSGDALITALRTHDHPRARALLATIQKPKLGSLQRWVRECDAAQVASVVENAGYTDEQRAVADNETWRTLEAIIRTTTPTLRAPPVSNPLIRFPPWELQPVPKERVQVEQMVKGRKICSKEEAERFRGGFELLHTIPATERKPPNLHPALIWTSKPNTISIPLSTPPVTAHPVPDLPGATLLQNVLPEETCRAIIGAAETIGFTPDQAAAGSATALASILAHNFYWMADETFSDALFERVSPFLPPTVAGLPLRSINRRYRCYRYVPGAIYRPHVDGAWPPSGIITRPTSNGSPSREYVYDSASGRQYSRFTFLVYLNDEFEGGETTFFVARKEGEGLEARAVRPRMGSVLVFPHGDAEGSLVHEGSPVKMGVKYIIRTDVVYDVPQGGRSKANLGRGE